MKPIYSSQKTGVDITEIKPTTGNYDNPSYLVSGFDNTDPNNPKPATFYLSKIAQKPDDGTLDLRDFAPLNGVQWNVTLQPKVIIDLVEPVTEINVNSVPDESFLFQAFVRQPQAGGKRLIVDGREIPLYQIDGKPAGNTRVIFEYIGSDLDVHADPSIVVGKPRKLSQASGGTVLTGQKLQLFGKFYSVNNLVYRWEKDGVPVNTYTGNAIYLKVVEDQEATADAPAVVGTTGAWVLIAKDSVTGLEERTDPMIADIGEYMAAQILGTVSDQTVSYNDVVTIDVPVDGVPTPQKYLQVQTGTDPDTSEPVFSDVAAIPAGGYNLTVTETKTYRIKALNRNGVNPAVPAYSQPFTITKNGLPQDAPTNGVVDDTANTFSWTDAQGKTPQDAEYSISGSAYTKVTTYPIPVGDVNLPAGALLVRYYETAANNASATLANSTAFIGSLIAPPTNLTFTAENPDNASTGLIQWTKSVETLNPSTQEYSTNYSSTNKTWTDISDNKLAISDNIAAGDFAVREKARPGKVPSTALVNTQPFVTALSSNYTYKTGVNLQTIDALPFVYDDANPFVLADKGHVLVITDGSAPKVSLFAFDVSQQGNPPHSAINYTMYDDNGTGVTNINPSGAPMTNVKWKVVKGITNGGGTRGTNLVHKEADYFLDPDSPPTGIAQGDIILVKQALKGVSTPLKYQVADYQPNNAGYALMHLVPYNHTTPLPRTILGGIWEKSTN